MNQEQSNSAFSGSVVPLRNNVERLVLPQPSGRWVGKVQSQLERLMALKPGWDGYQGQPVSLENAFFTLKMLEAVCGDEVEPPQIVPGPNGDLQIEWHTVESDIELHVIAPYHVHAWRQVAGQDVGEELELKMNFAPILNWIGEMTEPDLAVGTAAA